MNSVARSVQSVSPNDRAGINRSTMGARSEQSRLNDLDRSAPTWLIIIAPGTVQHYVIRTFFVSIRWIGVLSARHPSVRLLMRNCGVHCGVISLLFLRIAISQILKPESTEGM